jgi:hypothetical protein
MAEIRINTTGGLKLYDADNSHYAQIVAGTITSNVDAITLGHDTVTIADNLSLGSDSAILKFGADTEIALTHVADTGLKLTDSGGTPTLQLHDANESIASDGSKVIITSGGTAFSLPTSDGSNGQVLSTNGSGVLSFATASSADPTSADGDSLGTASAEWSDLYLADGGIIYFGNDQEITLTHSADSGLLLKHTATADDKPINLVLQTGETDMAADDVIGKISWQAPDEGTGTDAVLVAAAIQAVSEGDFSSSNNATSLQFMTGASEAAAEKMTLTSGGILNTTKLGVITDHDLGAGIHVRTADSSSSVSADADELVLENSGAAGMTIASGTSSTGSIYFSDSGSADIGQIQYNHNTNYLMFRTNDGERMRITSSGYVQIGNTSGSARLDVETPEAIVGCLVTCTSASYDANIINLVASRDTTNETYNILRGQNGAGFAIAIRDSGNVENVNNSYGSSSDERIKQNIVDAKSQWDDIKALKIRNYKLKKEVAKGVDKTYLGVVAQEVETAGMNGLIGGSTAEDKETVALSSDFGTLYEDGDSIPEDKAIGDIKTTNQKVKSVKYSILYMKAIKALQEAQTRIETLETKVAALEG